MASILAQATSGLWGCPVTTHTAECRRWRGEGAVSAPPSPWPSPGMSSPAAAAAAPSSLLEYPLLWLLWNREYLWAGGSLLGRLDSSLRGDHLPSDHFTPPCGSSSDPGFTPWEKALSTPAAGRVRPIFAAASRASSRWRVRRAGENGPSIACRWERTPRRSRSACIWEGEVMFDITTDGYVKMRLRSSCIKVCLNSDR